MKILLFGPKLDYEKLIDYFEQKGYEVDIPNYKNKDVNEYDLIVIPLENGSDPLVLDTKTILTSIKKYGSFITKEEIQSCFKNYLSGKEEKMHPCTQSNPDLVKEGIVADLIINQDMVRKQHKTVIIGYQNIGRKLAYELSSIGVDIIVGVEDGKNRRLLKYADIKAFSIYSEEFEKVLSEADVIINTLPEYKMTEKQIQNFKENSYVIDTSYYTKWDASSFFEKNISYKRVYTGITESFEDSSPAKILSIKIMANKI